ncbi:MAG: hypothetical protein J6P84_00480 [Alphaproteobacteria bacterium]|nr:hypothetical protein [Alphaproteobacteria bacterium]
MKKLLVFAAILSFCTTETYGFWKGIGNVLNTAATVSQQLNPNMQQPGNQMQYNPYGTPVTTAPQQNVMGNIANNVATGMNQLSTNAINYAGNTANNIAAGIQPYGNRAINLVNNAATAMQQVGNQLQYNAGMMGTQVNTAAILTILQKMIELATEIRNTYGAQYLQITTWSQTLIGTLTKYLSSPNQVLLGLSTICQYIVNIYNILNQIGAGSQIEKLADGFSDLFYTCLGINPEQ